MCAKTKKTVGLSEKARITRIRIGNERYFYSLHPLLVSVFAGIFFLWWKGFGNKEINFKRDFCIQGLVVNTYIYIYSFIIHSKTKDY